jgi:hypothetical protein
LAYLIVSGAVGLLVAALCVAASAYDRGMRGYEESERGHLGCRDLRTGIWSPRPAAQSEKARAVVGEPVGYVDSDVFELVKQFGSYATVVYAKSLANSGDVPIYAAPVNDNGERSDPTRGLLAQRLEQISGLPAGSRVVPNGYREPVADMVAESLMAAARLMVWDVHDALGAKFLGTPAGPLLQHQAQQIVDSVVTSWKGYAKQLDRDDFKVAVAHEAHDALAISPSCALADALLGRSVSPYIPQPKREL